MSTTNKKRIVIVGATSSIAEHCARLWVMENNIELILIGRDAEKTERIACDLRVRNSNAIIHVMTTNFIDPAAIQQTVQTILVGGTVNTVLIAHGVLPNQMTCQTNLSICHDALVINGISPILFAEAFADAMEKANFGTLAVIGSVAGDRGRKSNYIYGAAKGMLERYLQGLAHRAAKTKVKIILVKPGPTDTPMTIEFKQKGRKLASASQVAKDIVGKIQQGKAVIYTPSKWFFIMSVIKRLPVFIFNKLEI
jgi:decaprenylphospho-beta-D-erythro-pentofuranosid-2-ulose 2-reductase